MKLLRNEKEYKEWITQLCDRLDIYNFYANETPTYYPCYVFLDYRHNIICLYRSDLERMLEEMK